MLKTKPRTSIRSINGTEDDWETIDKLADAAKMARSPYVVQRALLDHSIVCDCLEKAAQSLRNFVVSECTTGRDEFVAVSALLRRYRKWSGMRMARSYKRAEFEHMLPYAVSTIQCDGSTFYGVGLD